MAPSFQRLLLFSLTIQILNVSGKDISTNDGVTDRGHLRSPPGRASPDREAVDIAKVLQIMRHLQNKHEHNTLQDRQMNPQGEITVNAIGGDDHSDALGTTTEEGKSSNQKGLYGAIRSETKTLLENADPILDVLIKLASVGEMENTLGKKNRDIEKIVLKVQTAVETVVRYVTERIYHIDSKPNVDVISRNLRKKMKQGSGDEEENEDPYFSTLNARNPDNRAVSARRNITTSTTDFTVWTDHLSSDQEQYAYRWATETACRDLPVLNDWFYLTITDRKIYELFEKFTLLAGEVVDEDLENLYGNAIKNGKIAVKDATISSKMKSHSGSIPPIIGSTIIPIVDVEALRTNGPDMSGFLDTIDVKQPGDITTTTDQRIRSILKELIKIPNHLFLMHRSLVALLGISPCCNQVLNIELQGLLHRLMAPRKPDQKKTWRNMIVSNQRQTAKHWLMVETWIQEMNKIRVNNNDGSNYGNKNRNGVSDTRKRSLLFKSPSTFSSYRAHKSLLDRLIRNEYGIQSRKDSSQSSKTKDKKLMTYYHLLHELQQIEESTDRIKVGESTEPSFQTAVTSITSMQLQRSARDHRCLSCLERQFWSMMDFKNELGSLAEHLYMGTMQSGFEPSFYISESLTIQMSFFPLCVHKNLVQEYKVRINPDVLTQVFTFCQAYNLGMTSIDKMTLLDEQERYMEVWDITTDTAEKARWSGSLNPGNSLLDLGERSKKLDSIIEELILDDILNPTDKSSSSSDSNNLAATLVTNPLPPSFLRMSHGSLTWKTSPHYTGLATFPGLAVHPFWNDHPQIDPLLRWMEEELYPVLQQEWEVLRQSPQLQEDAYIVTSQGLKWTKVELSDGSRGGHLIPEGVTDGRHLSHPQRNCYSTPKVCQLINEKWRFAEENVFEYLPIMRTRMMFSVIAPDTYMGEHSGQGMRINLQICVSGCSGAELHMGGIRHEFVQGKAIAWQDGWRHEVLNRGDGSERWVFMITVLHPELESIWRGWRDCKIKRSSTKTPGRKGIPISVAKGAVPINVAKATKPSSNSKNVTVSKNTTEETTFSSIANRITDQEVMKYSAYGEEMGTEIVGITRLETHIRQRQQEENVKNLGRNPGDVNQQKQCKSWPEYAQLLFDNENTPKKRAMAQLVSNDLYFGIQYTVK